MPVGAKIAEAFAIAHAQFPGELRAWQKVSNDLGGRLPESMLVHSIQREGFVDLVLRCMEKERTTGTSPHEFHYQWFLTEYWISGLYESLRLLRDRDLILQNASLLEALADLELIRMAIDKHEIRGDTKLKIPLELVLSPDGSGPTHKVYSRNDSQRAFIPPIKLSEAGSMIWHVIDGRSMSARWIDRLSIADRLIEPYRSRSDTVR